MGAPKKVVVRQARAQRVSNILEAARASFSERGYENTTMAEIAAQVGVVEGSVYKYFDSKRNLLLRVIETWYEGLVEHFAHDLAGIKGTRNRLRYLVWQHLVNIRRDPQFTRLMFREDRLRDDYYRSPLHRMNARYTEFLLGVVREGIAAGDFRDDVPPALVRDIVFGAIEHHAWNFLCGRGTLDADRIADQITDILCNGLELRSTIESDLLTELRRETARLARIATQLEQAGQRPTAAKERA
jgi:AcrR family transcriptional regulator